MVTVGTRLRIIRKDAGLSQVELGNLAGSNQSAINRYEIHRRFLTEYKNAVNRTKKLRRIRERMSIIC